MGNTDSIPVISQAKSVVQALSGDTEGAEKTQENFTRGCPGVSLVRLGVELAKGDDEGAKETFEYFWKGVGNVADGTPGVGHAKGLIHYACGDREGGDDAMKSASRTTGVMAAGVGGFVVGGPVGAVLGGIEGGLAMDSIITIADSAVHEKPRPYGYVQTVDRVLKKEITPGEVFDACLTPVFDGLAGHGAGQMYEKLTESGKPGGKKVGKSGEPMDVISDTDSGFESDMTSSSWENRQVNNVRVDNNCANCSVAGVNGLTVEQLARQTGIVPDGLGTNLQTIVDMHNRLGQSVYVQDAINVSQLKGYLDQNLHVNQKLKVVVAYERSGQSMGHVVSLKAKKLANNQIQFKSIDFQANSMPRKYYNGLPPCYQNGNSMYLFDNHKRY